MQSSKKSFLQRINPLNWGAEKRASGNIGQWSNFWERVLNINSDGKIIADPYTSSTLTAIARAQSIIADGIASMPLKDYKRTPDGKEEVYDSAVSQLLREPIPGMTGYTFRRLLTLWAVKYGNGIAYIEKTPSGRPLKLIPILKECVTQTFFDVDGLLWYKLKVNGSFYTVNAYEVIHIKYNSDDGYWGISPLETHARSLGINLNAEKYGLDYFNNGAKPAFYASTPAALREVDRKALQTSLKSVFAENNNGFALLDNDLMLHSMTSNPSETQFTEVRAYGIAEASRIYGVPKYMLADASDSSYTNSETEYIHFYNSTLMAHAISQEQEYSMKLYTEVEKRSRYLKHSFNSLMRADSTTRAEFYGALFRMGVMNTNEIRTYEDMNTVEEGNTRFTDANLIPLDKFSEFYDAKISVLIGQDLANQANNNQYQK